MSLCFLSSKTLLLRTIRDDLGLVCEVTQARRTASADWWITPGTAGMRPRDYDFARLRLRAITENRSGLFSINVGVTHKHLAYEKPQTIAKRRNSDGSGTKSALYQPQETLQKTLSERKWGRLIAPERTHLRPKSKIFRKPEPPSLPERLGQKLISRIN
ncbi:hypothetical protein EVAR_14331_1 [Eumeta japonica]|uniref:Uncharacterized protein n=1 Tax=Eumeta variegata TaxID=151549 RepID=A0A4C1UMV4_EUMVA|nr:hypothetical protein EVAR_14331_1 [Eumeta japonica]